MDIVAPLAKTGAISEAANLWLAVPIGFLFGLALYHGGFTDARKVGRFFYLYDTDVPVVMMTAIITGMIGLWLLILVGVIDASKMYFLPTFLLPMAVGGLLFGVGMALSGFCPGTAAASVATGRIDALVFLVGFLGGSMLFGDLFPVWGEFYNSDYRGVYRLDQLFGMELGLTIFIVITGAIAGVVLLKAGQRYFWPDQAGPENARAHRIAAVTIVPVIVSLGLAFFPTKAFLPGEGESDYYIVPKESFSDGQAGSNPAGAPATGQTRR